MGLFDFLKSNDGKKQKGAYKEGAGFDLIRQWCSSDEVFPDNPLSLVNAYKNLVYACATKNAQVVSRQKLHLYMSSPKGYKSKSYHGNSIDKAYFLKNMSQKVSPGIKAKMRFSENTEITEITEHPFLDLFYNPNNFFAYTEFMMLTDLYLELTGNSYWNIKTDSFGIPKRLDLIPSQNLKPILGEKEYIKYYEYDTNSGKKKIYPKYISHCRFPNPRNIAIGTSPLSACVDSVDLDLFALKYGKAIFKNSGVLSGYFRTKDALNETSFARIKKEVAGFKGYRNAGKTPLLDNGLEYVATSVSPQLLFDSMITKKTDKDIARAYGVPISLIDVQDVNKANAETGNNTYEEHTIDPRLLLIADKINQSLLSFYKQNEGISIFCCFDNPAKEDNAFVLKKQSEHAKWGIRTINELRKEEGYAPLPDGDYTLVPVNYGQLIDGEIIIASDNTGDNNGNDDGKSEEN